MQRSLLIGCGNSRAKKLFFNDAPDWAGELTTIDIDPNCGADIVRDLSFCFHPVREEAMPSRLLPFEDDTFDELGAYDCLEHWGQQGDWRGWFSEMAEFHRITKPGGMMGIIVPIGADALADPGHTRFFSQNYFLMLTQKWYADQIEKGKPVTDYRWYIRRWWEILFMEQQGNHHLAVLLRKA